MNYLVANIYVILITIRQLCVRLLIYLQARQKFKRTPRWFVDRKFLQWAEHLSVTHYVCFAAMSSIRHKVISQIFFLCEGAHIVSITPETWTFECSRILFRGAEHCVKKKRKEGWKFDQFQILRLGMVKIPMKRPIDLL